MSGRKRSMAAVLGVVMLLGTGCSDGGREESEGSGAPTSEGSRPADDSTDESTDDSTGSGAEVTGTVPDVGEPVATRTITQEGNTYRLDVFPLAFDEGSPGVSANVRLVFEEMATPVVRQGLLASQEDQGSVRMKRASGLQVVDREGGTAYLPAEDADGMPLCSPEVPSQAAAGDQVYVTCVFGGLDADVASLDLVVPNFGTFRDVSSQ